MNSTIENRFRSKITFIQFVLSIGIVYQHTAWNYRESLRKLGSRYGTKMLETACECMLAFTSTPSIRTITTLLKNSHRSDHVSKDSESGDRYGITRGAAYWKKGGGGNVD